MFLIILLLWKDICRIYSMLFGIKTESLNENCACFQHWHLVHRAFLCHQLAQQDEDSTMIVFASTTGILWTSLRSRCHFMLLKSGNFLSLSAQGFSVSSARLARWKLNEDFICFGHSHVVSCSQSLETSYRIMHSTTRWEFDTPDSLLTCIAGLISWTFWRNHPRSDSCCVAVSRETKGQ